MNLNIFLNYKSLGSSMAEEETQITIEDLQLSLEIYEIESEQKLAQLQSLFKEKGQLDLAKMFYEERSSIEIKFQNIIGDLIQFLVKQEVATTEKLRKTFYRILENPLLLLFKVSRFQIFDLRLNGFDIELEPIDAICELAKGLDKNIEELLSICGKEFERYDGKIYKSQDAFLEQANLNFIQDKLFVFYSYLRKGSSILKKKFENKVKVVDILNNAMKKLLPVLLKNQDAKTIKELSILNYEIYELENSFDVLYFYMNIPFQEKYKQSFHEFELLAQKSQQGSNYNLFILQFARFGKEIIQKLANEKIDPFYKQYIENALKAILEMWGCRICYYREFCQLFQNLFKLYPDEIDILSFCLKHTPDLKKDDIVLLRTNFKLELDKKHHQLLSLMKSLNIEEINDFLSTFYHRTFYNLNFKEIDRERTIELLTLVNGNSSLSQFFQVSEKAMREWNHSIDFAHSHKFIESQFSYPKITHEKVKESLRLLTNLCTLEEKGFDKEYENLIKGNTLGKAMLGLANYIKKEERCQDLRETSECQKFIVESFNLIKKCLNPATESQSIVQVYTGLVSSMKDEKLKACLEEGVISYIRENIENFHISTCLNSFSNFEKKNLSEILSIFMEGVKENNKIIKNFRFIGEGIDKIQGTQLSKEQVQFIEKNYTRKGAVLSFKDAAIFKFSDLEVMTNPVQFDKVMDNFYFNLDSNSKKFIEFISFQWNEERRKQGKLFPFYLNLLSALVSEYPVSVPLLASVRLPYENGTKRFIEMLSITMGEFQGITDFLIKIIENNCIRYKNGKDYVQEEIVPMATKEIINKLNSGDAKAEHFWVLGNLYNRTNLAEFKLDTILKSIEKTRYAIQKSTSPQDAVRLSEAYSMMIRVFFMKKERELKKVGLLQEYEKVIWNEVRNFVSKGNENNKQLEDVKIVEHIIVTPFTISQDFNISEYRIRKNDKVEKKPHKDEKAGKPLVLTDVLKKLPVVEEDNLMKFSLSSSHNLLSSNQIKKIDLRNCKYDLKSYLGAQNMEKRFLRENIELIFTECEQNQNSSPSARKDDLVSFIHFYMKELEVPSINHKIILQDVTRMLKDENPSISHLWVNNKNLEYYFMDLFSIFEYASLEEPKRQPESDLEVKEIVEIVSKDSDGTRKKILKIFEGLGYSNIWAESLNIFWTNFPIRKFLGLNAPSQESVLSIVLKATLENPTLSQSLTDFLGSLFESREDQNALMYKVAMDRGLMNLIMKSLSLKHLDKISLMFHSNFNNLRLYTDQLHEGLKALNIASKNRSYNQFIKLSKSVEDEQFYGPMKLFKQNFSFFIRIEKEGYMFKKNQEIKLALDRLANVFRNAEEKENITGKVNEVLEGYIREITQLQEAIANRVKSFYLVTKLRDLSYQNSLMIPIIHEVMNSTKHSEEEILAEIDKVQIFSYLNSLNNELVRFEDDWRNHSRHSAVHKVDGFVLENQITFCTTKRFAHSMSKVYQKCDLEFDEIIQRCVDVLKPFFASGVGKKWLNKLEIYPAFLTQSFIDHEKAENLTANILQVMKSQPEHHEITVSDQNLIEGLAKGFRNIPRKSFCQKNSIKIAYKGRKLQPNQIIKNIQEKLRSNQTLICLKNTQNLVFNKYKTSEATLEEIEVLGYLISYSLLTNQPIQINLHPSIVSALSFNISQLDYLLDIDFKIWEEMRNVLSVSDSASLTLNFSYLFESLETFKPVRVELVDKGSSKKVNNLNREEYCDLVACYILYEQIRPQVTRILSTILSIVPKDYIACLPTKKILSLFYDKAKTQKILDDYMKKIGVVLPQTLIDPQTGKRYENLKDFQNVQWLQEAILDNQAFKNKFWKDETNLFVVTSIGAKGSLKFINGKFLVEHFNSKEQVKAALSKL